MISLYVLVFVVGASAGIGFAIPVDTLNYVVSSLIRDGKVVRPAIGIGYLEGPQTRLLGIDKGVLVLDVPKDSPAYRSGLLGTSTDSSGVVALGDIIIGLDADVIDTEVDLFRSLDKHNVGDEVTLKVLRSERLDGGSMVSPDQVRAIGGQRFRLTEKVLRVKLTEKKSPSKSQ